MEQNRRDFAEIFLDDENLSVYSSACEQYFTLIVNTFFLAF